MAIIRKQEKKVYEQPEAGMFAVSIIDVVQLGLVKSTYNGIETEKEKIQVVWALGNGTTTAPLLDSKGDLLTISGFYNKNINMNPKTGKKSNLYELIEQVFQTPPGIEFEDETFIGRVNSAFLVRETSAKNGNTYTNIKGLVPLPAGQVAPIVPAGKYVRRKDRVKNGQTQPTAAPADNLAAAVRLQNTSQLPSNDKAF